VHLVAVHYTHVTAYFEPGKHLIHQLIEVLRRHAGVDLWQQLQQLVSVHRITVG
jgi:hypothetical protein